MRASPVQRATALVRATHGHERKRSHAGQLTAVAAVHHRCQFTKEWMSVSGLRTAEGTVTAVHRRRCTECGCQLSRYNDEDCCSACRRGQRADAPAPLCVPEYVWNMPEVRSALKGRDFGRLCTLVRSLGRLRQDDIAQLTGLSQAFLSMLESGDRKLTHIDKIVMLLDGLDVPVEITGPMLRNSTEVTPLRRVQHAPSHLQPAQGPDTPCLSPPERAVKEGHITGVMSL